MLVFTACEEDDKIEAPSAAFSASEVTVDAGQTVTFTDKSSNDPTSWAWEFPGGLPLVSTDENPEVFYATPGTYSVSLTVANEGGSDAVTKTDYITVVAAAPNAAFSVSSERVDPGETVTLTDESTGDPETWEWVITNPNGLEFKYYTQNVEKDFNTLGYYEVSLTVANEHGEDTKTKTEAFEVYAPGLTVNNTTPSTIKVEYEGTYEYIDSEESKKIFDQDGNNEITYQVFTLSAYGLDLYSDEETVDLSEGDKTIDFEISSDYFYLTLENNTNNAWNEEIINAGLQSEMTADAYINWSTGTKGMGYFNLWSNTEIQCHFEGSSQYIYWDNIPWNTYGSKNIVLELVYDGKKSGENPFNVRNIEKGEADQTIILKAK